MTSIGTLAPDLLEEMRGIADGVGEKNVDLLDIVAINARSEIALGQWNDGCTCLAWNMGSRQVLAQNWDWRRSVGENLALAHIIQQGKPDIWMVIEVHTSHLRHSPSSADSDGTYHDSQASWGRLASTHPQSASA